MNYILQLNSAFSKIYEDDRLTPAHFSLYMAMFQQWNLNAFPQKMFIFRNEIMRQSKIGSKSNYHSKLRDLDRWGYLRYYPSKNAFKGSMIEMIIFKNSKRQIGGNFAQMRKQQLGEERLFVKGNPETGQISMQDSPQTAREEAQHNPQAAPIREQQNPEWGQNEVQGSPLSRQVEVSDINKYKHKTNKPDKPASEEEVINFFISGNCEEAEAIKFLNYYSSRDWKTGGDISIRNWKKVAEKWIVSSLMRTAESSKNLKTTKSKNYGQPL